MEKNLLDVLLVIIAVSIPVCAWSDCISEFDCGIGYRCVKAQFTTYGVCMKSVNEYGMQQYDLPRLDSRNPKYEADCDFDTDCPIGFYSHRKFKVCVKR
jgi:hypothetical protein